VVFSAGVVSQLATTSLRAPAGGAPGSTGDDLTVLVALFIGLSIPVIGAGVALDQGASAPDTVLGFAILVGLGVAAAGWELLGRAPKAAKQLA
jgi:hypothetical protein